MYEYIAKSDDTKTTIQVTVGLMKRFQIAQSTHHVITGDKLSLPQFLSALLDMFDEREV